MKIYSFIFKIQKQKEKNSSGSSKEANAVLRNLAKSFFRKKAKIYFKGGTNDKEKCNQLFKTIT